MDLIKKIPNKKLIEAYKLLQTVKGWQQVKIEICAGLHHGYEVCLTGYKFSNNKIADSLFDCHNSIDEAIESLKKMQ